MTTLQEEIIRLQTAKTDIQEALIAKGISVDETESISTYAEKINSMTGTGNGEKGDPGASAYEIAVKNGFEGTELEWLASLKGEKGEQGLPGEKGDTGAKGEPGIQGVAGEKGESGASAYEIAVNNGFNGTETEWLASLKGEKGNPGPQGIQGVKGESGPQGIQGEDGADGQNGLSAYEIAVNNGFIGSEAEWLASLKGEKGEPGDASISSGGITKSEISTMIDEALNDAILNGVPGESAYEVAVSNGFKGTEEEWLASLKGETGKDGTAGERGLNGLSAYEVAVSNGFIGTETEWLASLKGKTGANGINGENGADGASAYQIALNNGFEGTEEEWLASLKGDTGEQGIQGETGPSGASAYEIAVNNGFEGTETEWLASLKGEKGDTGSSSSSGGGSGASYVVETSYTDTSWYRIWSDGWVEQGGFLVTTSASSRVITLPIEMASNLFNINFHIVKGGSSNNTTNNVRIDSRKTTSTSITLYVQPSDETYTSWTVMGMKKQ